MPDITPNLGIKKPLGNENVSRASFNENWDIIDANAAPRSITQLKKITADSGDVAIAANTSSDDILAKIVSAGIGLNTFYASSTSVNLPTSDSIRGISHITSTNPANGYVLALDYYGNSFTNYILNGTWQGWKKQVNSGAPTWTNLVLQNGWVSYGGSDPTPQYTKIGAKVRLKGTIKGGTAASGVTLFTLPSGNRPSQRVIATATTAGGTNDLIWIRIFIEPTGAVNINSSWVSSTWISLDGIEFVADGN